MKLHFSAWKYGWHVRKRSAFWWLSSLQGTKKAVPITTQRKNRSWNCMQYPPSNILLRSEYFSFVSSGKIRWCDILKLKNLFILAASLGRRFENRQRICCAIPHVAAVRIRDADRCPWVSLSTDVQNHTFAIAVKNSYTVVSKSGQSPFHNSYEFERRYHPHTTKSHGHIPPRSHSLTDRTIVWERLAVVYHDLW